MTTEIMKTEYAVISCGCFWCTEAIFKDVIGVQSVESGYTGGILANPTYEQVCSGTSGHAEAIRISFNTKKVTYSNLLDISFAIHDPTQLNRQGNDVGTQYRSAIFPANAEQKAEAAIAITRVQEYYNLPVVTKLEPLKVWYPAEDYHQNYWNSNGQHNSYCWAEIPPKQQKLRKKFTHYVK